ncbi:MAG: LysR family transcriptional regulator [Ferrovibrio sp.]|uniref:LysR family transcriptional regulator n=1 Tax=Ferrovibrio sp. TaxID=1917215 RepID=UPI00261074DF|nr:LysR family transcriptional regulator [Ferrovibrio sp.]MCW0236006.1 LysR family transcriptional regulator [Ferrovibrio sp.]
MTRTDRLRLRHLRLLDAVEVSGSLSRAAAQLGLSQPAATKILREVETVVGAALYERLPRGVRLTPAGHAVVERLRIGLVALDRALGSGKAAPRRRLSVGALPVVTVDLLPQAIAGLMREGIDFDIEVTEGTVPSMLADLRSRQIDCFIGRVDAATLRDPTLGDLFATPLLTEGLSFATSRRHPLARRRSVSLADIVGESWVLAPLPSFTRVFVDQHFINHGLERPRPVIESLSFHTNLQIVGRTDLVTVAPFSAIAHYSRLGLVQRLRVDREPVATPLLFLAHRETMALRSLQQFAAALQAAVGEIRTG